MTCFKKISVLVVIMAIAAAVFAEDAAKSATDVKDAAAATATCAAEKATCAAADKAACSADKAACGTDKCPKTAAAADAVKADAAKAVEATAVAADAAKAEEVIAATAGDVKITVAEVDQLVEPRLKNIPEAAREGQASLIKKRALDSLIFQKLLEKKFVENKIDVTDADLDKEIEKILADNNITVEDFKKRVVEMGRDFNEFRDQVRNGMKYQQMMDKLAADKLAVSEEDIKAYYDQNPDRFKQEEEVQASHILVKVDPNASEADKAAAKAKIDALLVRVKAGEDFAAIAKEASDCPSKENGGDLGFFTRDRMVKPFADAAFALEKGKTSDVVETQFGYHIILTTDKKDAKTIGYDEAKADIKTQLEDGKRREFAGQFREELLKNSNIVYYGDFKVEEKAPEAAPVQVPVQEPAKAEEAKPAAE